MEQIYFLFDSLRIMIVCLGTSVYLSVDKCESLRVEYADRTWLDTGGRGD